MAKTITLIAVAKYGYEKKQFVAGIIGRDSKFTFNREFLGRKEGKRGESTSVEVDEPGLYETRDIGSKGATTDEYFLVYPTASGIASHKIAKADAMAIAKSMEKNGSLDWEIEAIPYRIARLTEQIAKSKALGNPDESITLTGQVGSIASGETVTRGRLIEERVAVVSQLEDVFAKNKKETR